MYFDQQEVGKLRSVVSRARRILTISHRSPDGDTLGAALAWRHAFSAAGKQVVSYCIDEIPDKYAFLDGIKEFTRELGDLADYDLIIISDLGHIKLTGFETAFNETLLKSGEILNVDHHPTNNGYGTVNFVFVDAASTTEIIYFLLKTLQMRITPAIATALLTGLYTDTGSFMHDNVTTQTLHVASELVRFGADFASIVKYNFRVKPISTLNLWGRVLDRLRKNELGITSSAVTGEDFDSCKADHSELEGVVDFLNAVPGTKFSVLLSGRGDVVKGSLRTPRNDVDLTEIAGIFGGGGHKKASGFAMPGKITQSGGRISIVDESAGQTA